MGFQVGTIKKVLIDGISYNAKADIDATKKPRKEKEGIATSGKTFQKFTAIPADLESITLTTSPQQHGRLETLHDDGNVFPMSVTLADNSVYRCVGFINVEGRSTAEGTTTLTMTAEDEWTPFYS